MKAEQLNRFMRVNGRKNLWLLRNTNQLYEHAVKTYYQRSNSLLPYSPKCEEARPREENRGPIRTLTSQKEPSPLPEYPRNHKQMADQATCANSGNLLNTVMQASRRRSMSFTGSLPSCIYNNSNNNTNNISGSDSSSVRGSGNQRPSRERRRDRQTATGVNDVVDELNLGILSGRSMSLPPRSTMELGMGYTLTKVKNPPCHKHHINAIEKTTNATVAALARQKNDADKLMIVDQALKDRLSVRFDRHSDGEPMSSSRFGLGFGSAGIMDGRPLPNMPKSYTMPSQRAPTAATTAITKEQTRFQTLGERIRQFEVIQFADGPVTYQAFNRRTGYANNRVQPLTSYKNLPKQEPCLSFRNVLHTNHRQRSLNLRSQSLLSTTDNQVQVPVLRVPEFQVPQLQLQSLSKPKPKPKPITKATPTPKVSQTTTTTTTLTPTPKATPKATPTPTPTPKPMPMPQLQPELKVKAPPAMQLATPPLGPLEPLAPNWRPQQQQQLQQQEQQEQQEQQQQQQQILKLSSSRHSQSQATRKRTKSKRCDKQVNNNNNMNRKQCKGKLKAKTREKTKPNILDSKKTQTERGAFQTAANNKMSRSSHLSYTQDSHTNKPCPGLNAAPVPVPIPISIPLPLPTPTPTPTPTSSPMPIVNQSTVQRLKAERKLNALRKLEAEMPEQPHVVKGAHHLLAASASQVSAYRRAFKNRQQILQAEMLHIHVQHQQHAKKPSPSLFNMKPLMKKDPRDKSKAPIKHSAGILTNITNPSRITMITDDLQQVPIKSAAVACPNAKEMKKPMTMAAAVACNNSPKRMRCAVPHLDASNVALDRPSSSSRALQKLQQQQLHQQLRQRRQQPFESLWRYNH